MIEWNMKRNKSDDNSERRILTMNKNLWTWLIVHTFVLYIYMKGSLYRNVKKIYNSKVSKCGHGEELKSAGHRTCVIGKCWIEHSTDEQCEDDKGE